MTQEEAKDYVLSHLPCTTTGVVALFDEHFKGIVKINSLLGLSSRFLGYTKLVLTLSFPFVDDPNTPANTRKNLEANLQWWLKKHDFKVIKREFDNNTLEDVLWIEPPIEIKEDRGRLH
jgi:hypothetical protein